MNVSSPAPVAVFQPGSDIVPARSPMAVKDILWLLCGALLETTPSTAVSRTTPVVELKKENSGDDVISASSTTPLHQWPSSHWTFLAAYLYAACGIFYTAAEVRAAVLVEILARDCGGSLQEMQRRCSELRQTLQCGDPACGGRGGDSCQHHSSSGSLNSRAEGRWGDTTPLSKAEQTTYGVAVPSSATTAMGRERLGVSSAPQDPNRPAATEQSGDGLPVPATSGVVPLGGVRNAVAPPGKATGAVTAAAARWSRDHSGNLQPSTPLQNHRRDGDMAHRGSQTETGYTTIDGNVSHDSRRSSHALRDHGASSRDASPGRSTAASQCGGAASLMMSGGTAAEDGSSQCLGVVEETELDPAEALWRDLAVSLSTPAARAALHRLRYSTPLSLEVFSSLLEQFLLVDGADDFISPVHASTIMEFAGVRSAPYHAIIAAPLSLLDVRRSIAESHKQYARMASQHAARMAESFSSSTASPFFAPTSGFTTPMPRGGVARSRADPRGGVLLESTHAGGSGSGHGHLSPGIHPTPEVASASPPPALALSSAGPPSASSAAAPGAPPSLNAFMTSPSQGLLSLLDPSKSTEQRILTIAELERSLWHIAANCVVFNAPETRYPRTARHFALSCVEILIRYCEKQLCTASAI